MYVTITYACLCRWEFDENGIITLKQQKYVKTLYILTELSDSYIFRRSIAHANIVCWSLNYSSQMINTIENIVPDRMFRCFFMSFI